MADEKAWNLWHGCRKYSEGCLNCYMYALDVIHGVPEKSAIITQTKDVQKPLVRNRSGNFKIPPGFALRVNMTSDTFIEEADKWRDEMWSIIRTRKDVLFYLLTKRAARIAANLPRNWGDGYENVLLNITCENQRAFNERWPVFREIPAKHKGMNLAPLIGGIDISPAVSSGQIEHIDLAGESYGGLRPCHYEWVKFVSDSCRASGINFVFNSTGTIFIKDGKRYQINSKKTQAMQAFKSGLSYYHGPVVYRLFDPYDGHLLQPCELYTVRYNVYRCLTCTSMETCVGCTDCGSCKKVLLVDKKSIYEIRNTGEKYRFFVHSEQSNGLINIIESS